MAGITILAIGEVAVQDNVQFIECDVRNETCYVYLPTISSRETFVDRKFYINDYYETASVNPIIVVAPEGYRVNGQQAILLDKNGISTCISVSGIKDFLATISITSGGSGINGSDGSNNLTFTYEQGSISPQVGNFVSYSSFTQFWINISKTAKFGIDASGWANSISIGDIISVVNKLDASNIAIIEVVAINANPSETEFEYAFISGSGAFGDMLEYAISFVKNGSSSSSDYGGDSPSTVTVNGIPSGTVLTGLTFEYLLQNIYAPYLLPAFTSFSISGQSILIQVGVALSGLKNFIWGTSNSGNVQPNSIDIRDVNSNTLIATGLANDGAESVDIGIITNTSPISQSWRSEGVNTQLGAFISSNFTVNSIYPVIYGKVASGGAASGANRPTANQALIDSGTVAVVNSNGTVTLSFNTTPDDYMWFAIPTTSISKTQWYIDSLNNGSIGGAVSPAGNLFPAFDSVVVDSPTVLWTGISYKIYIANYQSGVVVPMELRN